MLYLVIDKNGKPLHKWSIDPEKDFSDYKIVGEALKNEFGNYEDSNNLKNVDGKVVVDEALKEQNQKIEAEQAKKIEDKKESLQRLKQVNPMKLESLEDIKAVIKDLVDSIC